MPEGIPTFDEFKAACRQEFAYLFNEFGFTEEPLPEGERDRSHCVKLPNGTFINRFAVWFRNGSLTIKVEGVCWGQQASLHFVTADGQAIEFIHVPADCSEKSNGPRAASCSQLDDVKRLAVALRERCEPLLRGDPGGLEEARRVHREGLEELCRRAAKAAGEAFGRKDYAQVVRLLSRWVAVGLLSPADEQRLEFARKHIG